MGDSLASQDTDNRQKLSRSGQKNNETTRNVIQPFDAGTESIGELNNGSATV